MTETLSVFIIDGLFFDFFLLLLIYLSWVDTRE